MIHVHLFFFPKEDETLAPTKSSSGAGGPDLQKAALGVEHAAPPAAAVSDTAKDMEQSQSKDSSSSKGGLQPDFDCCSCAHASHSI